MATTTAIIIKARRAWPNVVPNNGAKKNAIGPLNTGGTGGACVGGVTATGGAGVGAGGGSTLATNLLGAEGPPKGAAAPAAAPEKLPMLLKVKFETLNSVLLITVQVWPLAEPGQGTTTSPEPVQAADNVANSASSTQTDVLPAGIITCAVFVTPAGNVRPLICVRPVVTLIAT